MPTNICLFNSRSLRNKIAEISSFVSTHQVQIMAVSETWLGPTIPDTSISLPNFQAPFRKDRNEFGGGVCILVSDQLPCRRRADLESRDLELIWIDILLTRKRSILLGCCYRPPSSTSDFYNKLESSLENVADKDVILLGDFNAKHKQWCREDPTNRHGIALKELMDSLNFVQLCSSATHLDNNGKPNGLLDLAFTNMPSTQFETRVLPPIGYSDHLPVILETPYNVLVSEATQRLNVHAHEKWLFHMKNPEKLQKAFLFSNWKSLAVSNMNINDLWSVWKEKFFVEIREFIPKVDYANRPACRKNSAPWFNAHLRYLVSTKNKLFRRAARTCTPEHWATYRVARNKCNNAIKAAKAKYVKKQASALSDPSCPSATWWRIARELSGFKQHCTNAIPPLSTSTGDIVVDNNSKAEMFNEVFINQNTALKHDSFPIGPSRVPSTFSINRVSCFDVSKVISSLPNKLSAGVDGISYRLLKEAGQGLILPLTTLFNRSIELGQIPDEWKAAIITPVFKGGRKDRTAPTNYRPIALTSCVARVLEKIVNKQLLQYLRNKSLLFQHQSGFLPKHSTVTQLCFLLHQWRTALDNGEHIQTAFLDLSKAYDRVPIPALLSKLSNVGISSNSLQWFSSFLTDRTQCVKVDSVQSTWRKPKSGIPQGTVLGPTLFLVFINDLPDTLQTQASIFADDTTIYSSGTNRRITSERLTKDLNSASLWASLWGMLFNAEKSEHLTISTHQVEENHSARLYMAGAELPTVESHRHLGLIINSKLTWRDHIDGTFAACAPRIGMLNRLKGTLGRSAAGRIYTAAIRPRIEYACALWSGGNTSKLEKLQEKFCRQHQLVLPSLSRRFDYHTLVLFFKIKCAISPAYLNGILPQSFRQTSTYNLRKTVYPVPQVNKKRSLSEFFPRAIILWNSLPKNLHDAKTVPIFKRRLRDHLKL